MNENEGPSWSDNIAQALDELEIVKAERDELRAKMDNVKYIVRQLTEEYAACEGEADEPDSCPMCRIYHAVQNAVGEKL
jgi:hypothetical protein